MGTKTFYLVDFENVHSEGIKNIKSLTKTEQVHIFSTKNAETVKMGHEVLKLEALKEIIKEIDIDVDIVPGGDQSVDRHLISFLGYLLGIYGERCTYIIVSKDNGYNNIIKFWKEKGYENISKKPEIPKTNVEKNMLNRFMQRKLSLMGYEKDIINKICKFVRNHYKKEQMLKGIYNDLGKIYNNYKEVYRDVKSILKRYLKRYEF